MFQTVIDTRSAPTVPSVLDETVQSITTGPQSLSSVPLGMQSTVAKEVEAIEAADNNNGFMIPDNGNAFPQRKYYEGGFAPFEFTFGDRKTKRPKHLPTYSYVMVREYEKDDDIDDDEAQPKIRLLHKPVGAMGLKNWDKAREEKYKEK